MAPQALLALLFLLASSAMATELGNRGRRLRDDLGPFYSCTSFQAGCSTYCAPQSVDSSGTTCDNGGFWNAYGMLGGVTYRCECNPRAAPPIDVGDIVDAVQIGVDVNRASKKCFPGAARVHTLRGEVQMANIVVGDALLTVGASGKLEFSKVKSRCGQNAGAELQAAGSIEFLRRRRPAGADAC